MPRKPQPTQSVRQTRARSRLPGAPRLMSGLGHRGTAVDSLTPDPEHLTYSQVQERLQDLVMGITPPAVVLAVASAQQSDPEESSPLSHLSTPEDVSPVNSHDENNAAPAEIAGSPSLLGEDIEPPSPNTVGLGLTGSANIRSSGSRATSNPISSSGPRGSDESSDSNKSTGRNPSETPCHSTPIRNGNDAERDSSESHFETNTRNNQLPGNGLNNDGDGNSVDPTGLEQTALVIINASPEPQPLASPNHEPSEEVQRTPDPSSHQINENSSKSDSTTESLHIANLFATPTFPRSALTRPVGPRFSARYRPSSSSTTDSPGGDESNSSPTGGDLADDEASPSEANANLENSDREGEMVGNRSEEPLDQDENPGRRYDNTEPRNGLYSSPVPPEPTDGNEASCEAGDPSSSSSSSSSSHCTNSSGHKRRSGDDTDEDRPQGGDLFFYDTKRRSPPVRPDRSETTRAVKSSNTGRVVGSCFSNRIQVKVTSPVNHSTPSAPKGKRSFGNGDIPGLYGSPKRPRLNYDWYEQYHQLGNECPQVHGCSRLEACYERHAKWQRDWDEFFRVEDAHLGASQGSNNEENQARQVEEADKFHGLDSVDIKARLDLPKGYKVRTHPARLARKMRLKK